MRLFFFLNPLFKEGNRPKVAVGIYLNLLNRYILLVATHGLLVYVRYNSWYFVREKKNSTCPQVAHKRMPTDSYIQAPVLLGAHLAALF